MIHDDHVAGLEPVQPVAFDSIQNRHAEISKEDRQTARILRYQAAFRIDQPAAEIAHLVDHHIIGRAAERRRHFFRIGNEGVADNFQGDGMHVHGIILMKLSALAHVNDHVAVFADTHMIAGI